MASEAGPGQSERPAEGEGEESLAKFTWEEIAEHRSAESLWVVVHDKVYDITKFMDEVLAQSIATIRSNILCVTLSANPYECHILASHMPLFAKLGWQVCTRPDCNVGYCCFAVILILSSSYLVSAAPRRRGGPPRTSRYFQCLWIFKP